jgi:hypothetical protein
MDYSEEEDNKNLYKFEFYEPEDSKFYTDWVWLNPQEVSQYRSEYKSVKVRKATIDEESLYDEAYEDGYSVAMIMEIRSVDNGVTFRVEVGSDGSLTAGHKMFKCAVCDKHKDFDVDAAIVNSFYITKLVEDIAWHVCNDCFLLGLEIDGVSIES